MSTSFLRAIPVLASLDIKQSLEFYDALGFAARFEFEDYAAFTIGDVEIHLWKCDDKYIPDNTGCRVEVKDIEPLYELCHKSGAVHSNGPLREKPWGTREFVLLDPSGNIITFFERQ